MAATGSALYSYEPVEALVYCIGASDAIADSMKVILRWQRDVKTEMLWWEKSREFGLIIWDL